MRSINHSIVEFQLTQEDEHLLQEAIHLLGGYRTELAAGNCHAAASILESALLVLVDIKTNRQITE